MPMRFSTEAANADVMGEDPQPNGAPEGAPRGAGAKAVPPDRSQAPAQAGDKRDRSAASADKARDKKEAEPRPGKDNNAAGFVKDKDASKP